jgi:peptide/nickel transport system permease protein
MGRFVARRAIGTVLVLFAVSVIVFLVFNVIPESNPAQSMAGKNATPTLVASIEQEWGFDESLPSQYLTMMRKVFTGDLISYEGRENVDERIAEGIPATFSLCIGAAVIWMFFGVLFGYLSATKPGGRLDRALSVVSVTGISVPEFWLGAIFLNYLAYKLALFPTGDYVGLTEDPLQWAYHLILPWATLSIVFIGFYSRVLRSRMLDAAGEDHVRTARAKGLSERRVMSRHVLRNSLGPVVTLFGLDFGALLGGAIAVEFIFNLNGIGLYTYESLTNQDLPPVIAVVLFGAFFIVLFNSLVDVAYAYLDPQVKLGSSAR